MKQFKGIHGTTKSRTQDILKQGFAASQQSRRGKGAYFWAYGREKRWAIGLAKSWWEYVRSQGSYSRDMDPSFSALDARLQAEEDEVLDLLEPSLREAVLDLSAKLNLDSRDEKKLSSLYEMFISELEKEMGVEYKILKAVVSAPKGHSRQESFLVGEPVCYIARCLDCFYEVEEILHREEPS
jgi:hypothetical protein